MTPTPSTSPVPSYSRLAHLARAARWHRRGLGIAAAAVCLFASLSALAPRQPDSTAVVVAARDLASGDRIAAGDVRLIDMPTQFVPKSALTSVDDAVGGTLTGAQATGSVLTAAGLMSTRPPGMPGGERLVPFRVPDAGIAALLHVGDRISVVGTTADGGAVDLAADVRVAALPTEPADAFAAGRSGALVVVAADADTAAKLAAAAGQMPMSIVLR